MYIGSDIFITETIRRQKISPESWIPVSCHEWYYSFITGWFDTFQKTMADVVVSFQKTRADGMILLSHLMPQIVYQVPRPHKKGLSVHS